MNHAKLERSARLQRVLNVLRGGGWYSTREIIERAQVCAVNSCVSELKRNGYPYECRREGDVWRYRLISWAEGL